MTVASLIERGAIRDVFRQWDEGQQPIDAQLSESLAALSAFQSHLDAWHQDLLREREELRLTRETIGRDQSAAEQDQARLAEAMAELNASRDKVGALTTMLLSRTEELRVLDNRRAELVTELELSRAREKELKVTLDEIKQAREQERLQSTEEARHLRELLERRFESVDTPSRPERPDTLAVEDRAERHTDSQAADNPVLASVMEQFGKLRQQRALDRPALKKAR